MLEQFAQSMLAVPSAQPGLELHEALEWLPTPWSVTTGRAYLEGLRGFTANLSPDARSAEPWDDTLDTAAVALPEELFAEAREPLAVPDAKHWTMTRFNTMLAAFAEKIQMRERIKKVIEL
jgi:hypothetical protein